MTAPARRVTVTLPELDPVQREVLEDPTRFIVCPWGRRRGKSHLAALYALRPALAGTGLGWWIWPTHKMGRQGWPVLRRLGMQLRAGFDGLKIHEVDRAITFPGGAEVQMKSADDPDNLQGALDGLAAAVFDETGMIQERAWEENVAPALVDTAGHAMFTGKPKGRTWYYNLFRRGLSSDPADADWKSWHQTTFDSPYVPESEKARIRRDYAAGRIAHRFYAQEYLAEFLDDGGAVFHKVSEAATAKELDGPIEGHDYIIGVDWGKMEDRTAFAIYDVQDNALIHLDKLSQIDYTVQVGRLKGLCQRWKPREVIVERNSVGEPLVEQLIRDGLPVTPFLTTWESKNAAVESLQLAFENGAVRIIPDEVLIDELQSFTMDRKPSGRIVYEAGRGIHGGHGDCAMALIFAYSGVSSGPSVEAFFDAD